MRRLMLLTALSTLCIAWPWGMAHADPPVAPQADDSPAATPDEEIQNRLKRVLKGTGWFTHIAVKVSQGVVVLDGETHSVESKNWAGNLAQNTPNVLAVANRIEIARESPWDFRPAFRDLSKLWGEFTHSLPLVLLGFLTLGLSIGAGALATAGATRALRGRIRTQLLRKMLARTVGVLVVLIGVYILLRISGLTQLALTVVGGTGLIGLALGIAFRDITENFLASIFLSIQKPFETGDLIEVSDIVGYVQQLNMRVTVLMTLEGNLLQIPNSRIYKGVLRNFTSNCNRR